MRLNRIFPFCKLVKDSNIYYKIYRPLKNKLPLQTVCYRCKKTNIPITFNQFGVGWVCEKCWDKFIKPQLTQDPNKKSILFKDQPQFNPWRDLPNLNTDCKKSVFK